MPRITADTNVFISALNFKGKPFELLTLARNGSIELAMSEPIMAEITRVLRVKFKWPEEDIAAAERQITSFTKHVEPEELLDVVKEDPTDNRILERGGRPIRLHRERRQSSAQAGAVRASKHPEGRRLSCRNRQAA